MLLQENQPINKRIPDFDLTRLGKAVELSEEMLSVHLEQSGSCGWFLYCIGDTHREAPEQRKQMTRIHPDAPKSIKLQAGTGGS